MSDSSLEEECSKKIAHLMEMHQKGVNLNDSLTNLRSFKNPHIYTKLIEYADIEDSGTNDPNPLFDVRSFPADAYYDERYQIQLDAEKAKSTATSSRSSCSNAAHPAIGQNIFASNRNR